MENAARSASFWKFEAVEQLRVWRTMDERDEEPVIIYYSLSNPGASPSSVTVAYAAEPLAHYVIVSTSRPGPAEFRSFRIVDGLPTEEEINVSGGRSA